MARVGEVLQASAAALVVVHMGHLRGDDGVTAAAHASDSELEDHLRTLLAELARALVLIEDEGLGSRALRDGTEIQRLIAERHGVQRATLGWTEADVRREVAILRSDLEAELRRRLAGDSEANVEGALGVLALLLEHTERSSVRAWRGAAG
jgi:hypothetical protein